MALVIKQPDGKLSQLSLIGRAIVSRLFFSLTVAISVELSVISSLNVG